MKTIHNPEWICADCGERYGRRSAGMATFHIDECGVCGQKKAVTEPRDYGYLQTGWQDQFALAEIEKMANAARGIA